uniref:Uncharacterized protein n=1 Tax=Trichogramma kaykai TaxID=54128 RepID=A0ABD2VXD0_9HYME
MTRRTRGPLNDFVAVCHVHFSARQKYVLYNNVANLVKLLRTSSWVPRLTVHLNDLVVGVPWHARYLRRETRHSRRFIASYLEEATTVAWKLFRAHGSSGIRIYTIFSRVGLRLFFFFFFFLRSLHECITLYTNAISSNCLCSIAVYRIDTIECGTRKKLSRKRSKPLVL